jgi:hypothetical protein
MFRTLALAAALVPALAFADTCPWLDDKSAAETILATPQVTVEKNPSPSNAAGGVGSTTCRFKEKGELTGQLSVIVMEFGTEAQAKAAYEKELKSQGSRAKPSKVGGQPGFFTQNPGFSAGSFTYKGTRFVFVSHPFSKRVNEAIRKDPDGGPLSTHEIARRVLAKLPG